MNDPSPVQRAVSSRGPRRPWEERERKILDELGELFLAEGFKCVTMTSLAARLRISHRTLYRVAPRKPELVERVIEWVFRRLDERWLGAMAEASDPAERFAACLCKGAPVAGSAFWDDVEADPAARKIHERHREKVMAALSRVLEEGMRSGRFREVPLRFLVEVIAFGHKSFCDPVIAGELGVTQAEAAGHLAGVFLEGIVKDDGVRSPSPLTAGV